MNQNASPTTHSTAVAGQRDNQAGSTPEVTNVMRAAVRNYLAKLEAELRRSRPRGDRLGGWRSPASRTSDSQALGRYHQQISALLIAEGLPYLRSQSPLSGAPAGLRLAVAEYLQNHPEIFTRMEAAVFRPEPLHDFSQRDLLQALVSAPAPLDAGGADANIGGVLAGANFLAGEQRNRSLARAGEHFVLAFERQRLHALGLDKYADTVEHSAVELGDHAGYDVQSWDSDGSAIFIRIKTTRYGPETPFYLTENELAMAANYGHSYVIYRLFDFPEDPRIYLVSGPLERRCKLRPTSFRATPY